MKRGENILKQLGALLLAICLLFSTLGMTMAQGGEAAQPQTIEAFETMDKTVAEQSVPLGTALKDLKQAAG